MAREEFNLGTEANDGTGDKLRVAFNKSQNNFIELYNSVAALTTDNIGHLRMVPLPGSSKGNHGDVEGYVSYDANYLYVCVGTHDGVTDIWRRINWSGDVW